MNYIQTEIDGVWLIEPNVYSDERGYFMEAFKKEEFEAKIGPVDFVQDNESKSSFGVLRGLHYQKGEYSQAKLVRVLKGKVLDVAVDLRRSSSHISMAGISKDHTEAATMTPAANPVNILCILPPICFFRKKTQAAPAVVPKKGIRRPATILILMKHSPFS